MAETDRLEQVSYIHLAGGKGHKAVEADVFVMKDKVTGKEFFLAVSGESVSLIPAA